MTLDEAKKIIARQLSTKEIAVLKLYPTKEVSEIAARLGTTRQNIHRVIRNAKKKIEEQDKNENSFGGKP